MWPEKKRSNAWPWPEQETTDKLKEIEEELPHSKRWKSSSDPLTTYKWLSEFDPLKDPPPLGLTLDKSPAFWERIQKRLNEANKNKRSLPTQNLQVGCKKDLKARVGASDPNDKLKASNFPALLLKIGNWEYVAQHEDDLRAKCYFAKHRLVWEVLDGTLKNKIEIQWEDILSLKANFPENGPGSLTVTLRKEPLFFKENNPQPRKHTIWQPTSDFTGGEAITSRIHYLKCAQGVLNKHYEKLINCDTRLKFLSQQFDTVFDKPFPEASIKAPNLSHNVVSNRQEMSEVPFVDINGMVLQPTSQLCLVEDASFSQKDIWKNEVNGWQNGNYHSSLEGMISFSPSPSPSQHQHLLLKDANFAQTDAREDHVNGCWQDGNYYPTLEEIISSSPSQHLLKDANSGQIDAREDNVNGWQDGYNYSNLVSNLPSVDDVVKQMLEEDFGINVSEDKQDLGLNEELVSGFADSASQRFLV